MRVYLHLFSLLDLMLGIYIQRDSEIRHNSISAKKTGTPYYRGKGPAGNPGDDRRAEY